MRTTIAIVIGLFSLSAAQADTMFRDTVPGRADLFATRAIAMADRFAVLGSAGGASAIAWYGADGALVSARFVDPAKPNSGVLDAAPAADGGVFILYATYDGFGPVCRAAKLDAGTAQARWLESGNWNIGCHVLGTDAAGGLSVGYGNFVQHLAADGVAGPLTAFGPTAPQLPGVAVDPASGGVYVGVHHDNGGRSELSFQSADAKTRRVLWQAPDDATEFVRVAVGADGNVYAVGNNAAGGFALSLTSAGAVRWTQGLSANGAAVSAAAAAADGSLATFDDHGQLSALGPDGTIRWQQTPTLDACDGAIGCSDHGAQLALAANGDVLLLAYFVPELLRFDAHGNALARTRLTHALGASPTLATLDDAGAVIGPSYVSVDWPHGSAVLVTRDGSAHDAPLAALLPLPETPRASAQDASGAVYVLSESIVDNTTLAARSWLTKVAPDGTAAWKRSVEGSTYDALLQVDAQRVCFSWKDSQSHLQCRAAADGALLWDQVNSGVQAIGLIADGSTIAVFGDDIANDTLRAIAADGTVLHEATLPGPFTRDYAHLAITPSGTTVIAALYGQQAVYAFDRNGALLYRASPPYPAVFDRALSVDADGSALVVAQADPPYAWRIAPDGRTLWTNAVGTSAKIGAIANGTVSLLDYRLNGPGVALSRFDAVSGAPQGLVVLDTAPASAGLPDLDPAHGVAINTWYAGTEALGITLISMQDGHVLRQWVDDCADICSNAHFAARLGADDTLRLVASGVDDLGSAIVDVHAFEHATVAPVSVRADQAGIDGLWYAPYEAGQGFAFDYIPSAGLLFAPWFTYHAGFGEIDPGALAWFTLQGTVASGADSVDLKLARTAPGVFNSGSVAATRIGNASLRFSDCDHALLQYQFDAGAEYGVGGTIALARLSPSTTPCTLADGSTRAAQIANAPAQGFDARESGSWYDPDHAGQGFQLTVIPGGNGFGGLALGAWFTFDPAGSADDAQQQHWFTLQGDLSAASAGQAPVSILRTLGGALDFVPTHDTVQVGHGTLTFLACDRARFDFAFDHTEIAHAYAGLSGSASLSKIGGCAPP